MPVLSQSEYREYLNKKDHSGKEKSFSNDNKFHISPKQSKRGRELPQDCNKKVYYLLHPENGSGGDYQHFEDVLNIDGKDYVRKCERGIVKTDEEVLAEFLINKGYKVMEERTEGDYKNS